MHGSPMKFTHGAGIWREPTAEDGIFSPGDTHRSDPGVRFGPGKNQREGESFLSGPKRAALDGGSVSVVLKT